MHCNGIGPSVNGSRFPHGIDGLLTQQPTTLSAPDVERPSGAVTQTKLKRLLEYQSFKCALTGVELTPQTLALDHIKPLSSGGEDMMENVQLVHTAVNSMKGTLCMEEFVEWCKKVARHPL